MKTANDVFNETVKSLMQYNRDELIELAYLNYDLKGFTKFDSKEDIANACALEEVSIFTH